MDFCSFTFNFFIWFAALLDGLADLVHSQSAIYTKMEGEDLRVAFSFDVPEGSKKYLRKTNCEEEDTLIETNGNRLHTDRYIIRYNSTQKKVHAVIEALKKSDAVSYTVGYIAASSVGSYEFELKVRDLCDEVVVGEPRVYSAAEGGNVTVRCSLSLHPRCRKFLCREECDKFLIDTNDEIATSDRYKIKYGSRSMFNVTIGRLTESDSGRYRCGVGRNHGKNTCQEFEITVTGGEVSALVVSVTVAVAVLLAVSLVLLLCLVKCKTSHVHYVNTGANGKPREFAPSEDSAAASRREERVYQDLDPHTRDGNLYCVLSV